MIVHNINGYGIKSLSLSGIIQRIKRLDGNKITDLTLSDASDTHVMVIAGGPEYFLVDIHLDGEYFALLNPEGKPDTFRKFAACGQNVECSEESTPTLQQTIEAAQYFCEHGICDPALHWIKT